MFDILMSLFNSGKLSEAGLEAAVSRGWISISQKEAILSSTTTD